MTKIRKNVIKDKIEAERISAINKLLSNNLPRMNFLEPSETVLQFFAFIEEIYAMLKDPNVDSETKFRYEQFRLMILELVGLECIE